MDQPPLSTRDIMGLKLQRLAGWATFALVGPGCVVAMRLFNGNRVEGVERARAVYRDALATGRPVVVCANHLTMVDSGYLHMSLAPLAEYLVEFRRFSWNVAAVEHFKRNPILKTLVFLGKTLPIDRTGDDAHRKLVMDKVRYLVSQGEVLTLFPEGKRSRTGRIDPAEVTYGIGQILRELEKPLVLCAYLRGRKQRSASGVPARGDVLDLRLEPLEPTTTETGLRAVRDLSRQVIHKLKAMEDAWLAERGADAPAPAP